MAQPILLLSQFKEGRSSGGGEGEGRGGELNQKINPGTKPWRLGDGGGGEKCLGLDLKVKCSGDMRKSTPATRAHSLCHQMDLLRNSLSAIACSDLTHV